MKLRLGGWWRIWVVLSLLWVAGVAAIWQRPDCLASWQQTEIIRQMPARYRYIYSDSAPTEKVEDTQGTVAVGFGDSAPRVFCDTGADSVLFWYTTNHAQLTKSEQDEAWVVLRSVGVEYLRRLRSEATYAMGIAMVAPPAVLLISGLALAWIRAGFRRAT